ncbi:Sulfotransferase domain [Trinorchestia longiramus]|nr:Sulfotransferase domain [Trinorchestia longiramus]
MKLSNGAEITPISGEEAKDLQENFLAYYDGLVRAGPSKCVLPQAYTRYAERYLNFQFRSSDVLVSTYPKCGTTWVQEIIWTMLHNPDLDNPDASINENIRIPFIEFDALFDTFRKVNGQNETVLEAFRKYNPTASADDGVFLGLANCIPDRRVLKSHLPFSLLPANLLDTCKVVYVTRNPKDALASYLHHHRLIKVHDYQGSDDQFVDYYCRGQLSFGSYADHLVEAWTRKDHKNLLIISFEDLKRDTMAELQKINKFIGINLNNEQLENVKHHTSFSGMKQRMGARMTEEKKSEIIENQKTKTNYDEEAVKKAGFYRKGQSGAWKQDLTDENSAKIDLYIADKISSRIPDFKFSFELHAGRTSLQSANYGSGNRVRLRDSRIVGQKASLPDILVEVGSRYKDTMKLSNGAEVTPVTGEEIEELQKTFTAYYDGLVRAGPSMCLLPQAYTRFAERYLNFQFRSSDILLVTYPKCGTTWTQEIIWTMLHNPDLDNPDAVQHVNFRSPFIEFDALCDTTLKVDGPIPMALATLKKYDPTASLDDGVFLGIANSVPGRRVLKTHLPFSLLPENLLDTCKVVYVMRNPKDAMTSYLHHHRLIKVNEYRGGDDQFVDYYCNGQLVYGSYADHLAEAWQRKAHKNILVLHFEDLKRNTLSELRNIDEFIGTKLSEKQLENVRNHTSFSSMKERMGTRLTEDQKTEPVETEETNPNYNKEAIKKTGFYRKGKSGGWKEDLSQENSAKLDSFFVEKIASRMPDLKFSFE